MPTAVIGIIAVLTLITFFMVLKGILSNLWLIIIIIAILLALRMILDNKNSSNTNEQQVSTIKQSSNDNEISCDDSVTTSQTARPVNKSVNKMNNF